MQTISMGSVQWERLRILDVSWCSELQALPSMETLEYLEEFYAYGCVKLKRIWGLEQWEKLRILNANGCSGLEALPSMERLILEEFYHIWMCEVEEHKLLEHFIMLEFPTFIDPNPFSKIIYFTNRKRRGRNDFTTFPNSFPTPIKTPNLQNHAFPIFINSFDHTKLFFMLCNMTQKGIVF